jgi:selenoprotein W-related protein
LTAEILPHFKQDISEYVLVPSDKGKFEVLVDGELVHSKLQTGEFPKPRDIVKAIESRMKS